MEKNNGVSFTGMQYYLWYEIDLFKRYIYYLKLKQGSLKVINLDFQLPIWLAVYKNNYYVIV